MPVGLINQSHPLSIDRREYYAALADATPISLIMTKVEDFVTCEVEMHLSDLRGDAKFADFDHIPVSSEGSIIGLLAKEEGQSETVGDAYRALHPRFLLTERSPIYRFIERVQIEPCCLVLGAHGVSGMVTMSDLQKLPVQVALFGLIAQFEHLVSEQLRRSLGDPEAKFESVLGLLSKRAVEAARYHFDANERRNLTLDWVTPLPLGQKVNALKKQKPECVADWQQVQRIVDLRDNIFHAKEFAATYELIHGLVGSKRALISLIDSLSDALEDQN